MNLKRWTIVTLVAVLTLTGAAVVFAGRDMSSSAEPRQQGTAGQYMFVYSAKFVCGYQPPIVDQPGAPSRGEPQVKPGNYATELNIHNYQFKIAPLRKKLVLLVQPTVDGKDSKVFREPQATGPLTNAAGGIRWESLELREDYATLDDCNKFWQWTYPQNPPPSPFPLMIGYLVIYSPIDLDVDAVYTAAAPGPMGKEPQSVSIDVERVPGKRVFVPAGALQ
jgi:hypothetical protein